MIGGKLIVDDSKGNMLKGGRITKLGVGGLDAIRDF
jgi:hypothetical protein